jgi:hypothetical protein
VLVLLLRGGDFVVLTNPVADAARLDTVVEVVNQTIAWTLLFVALPVVGTAIWELRALRRNTAGGPSHPVAHGNS